MWIVAINGWVLGLAGLASSYKPTDTPHERADMMASVVPEGHVPIRNLTHEYARKQFSAEHTSDETFNPQEEWYQLRPLLIRQSIVNRLQRWQQRLRKQE